MSNLVPFNQETLPAHLQHRKGKSNDLTQGVGPGFARMSIKGKLWTVVRGDDRNILMNPKDQESPATYVGVVIIASSPDLSRTFYKKGFDENASAAQPDCSSARGDVPDPGVPDPQAKTCATCPHAVYGTGQNGKGFRCSNHRRMVIAKPGAYGDEDLMLLNVPGGSLKNLRAFSDTLEKRDVDYDMVLTKLTFDNNEATPKIIFTPAAFLGQEEYDAVQEASKSPTVQAILGSTEAIVQGVEDAPASDAIEGEPPKKAAPKKSASKKAAPKKAEKKPEPDEDDLLADAAAEDEPAATTAEDDVDSLFEDFDD